VEAAGSIRNAAGGSEIVKGVQFSGVASGIKASGLDLGLVYFEEPTDVAALYTRNRVKAAHILYNRKKVKGAVRALLVNSGCANACTGLEGVSDLGRIAVALASELDISNDEILFASTGVIGKRLPVDAIIAALPPLRKTLREKNIELFARAIMTTDTYPKIVQATVPGKGGGSIAGVAKGAGMMNPLFATMLSFLFTDCSVPNEQLKKMMPSMGRESFERITVDGDTSTNDTVMVFSKRRDRLVCDMTAFRENLLSLMKELSFLIVRDGEGATKVIHVTVTGAQKKEVAEKLARRISVSPLVKTAFFGCDPNWGRIIAAAGDAGVPIRPEKVEIVMQGECLARDGVEVPFSEEKLKKLMDKKELELVVDLHDGRASYDLYTTDLTFDYIKINASYRT
jgi:glutamate N-acetyltransferase / amino-acid N-acetyltransferase